MLLEIGLGHLANHIAAILCVYGCVYVFMAIVIDHYGCSVRYHKASAFREALCKEHEAGSEPLNCDIAGFHEAEEIQGDCHAFIP